MISLLHRGVRLLAQREHSRQELHRKLEPHAESAAALAEVLSQLQDQGLQSDHRFAEAFVRSRKDRMGQARLAQELRQRGVADSLIQTVLLPETDHELLRALQVWEKRFGEAPTDLQDRARQHRFLLSRGFPPNTLRRLEGAHFSRSEISGD